MWIQEKGKGILAKLLEQAIKILIKKECKKICNLKIKIFSSSTQIIKGEIQKINIIAEDINYKDLLFDQFELEANHLKIIFKITKKELYFIKKPIIKFKVSLSQNSLRTVLLSSNWNCIGNMISKKILNQEKLEDIEVKNDQLSMKATENNITNNQGEIINIKVREGKVYLENNNNNKAIQIPIEDKIYVTNVSIENNLINIFANSLISF
tara:strand:- start:116 stop:745 length:630 start_codon:yes stop_codon:yes gene_type:complete